jgi:predicted  nucleic acid-binding Zn-ribbon protein
MMADKYTKKAVSETSPSADAWKDAVVEKEYTPAKVKVEMSYRQLEQEVERMDADIARIQEGKAKKEAEMAKIKKAVEA